MQQPHRHQTPRALSSHFLALPVQLVPLSSSSSPPSRPSSPPALSYIFSAWQQRGSAYSIVLWLLHESGLYHSTSSVEELQKLCGSKATADDFTKGVTGVWKLEGSDPSYTYELRAPAEDKDGFQFHIRTPRKELVDATGHLRRPHLVAPVRLHAHSPFPVLSLSATSSSPSRPPSTAHPTFLDLTVRVHAQVMQKLAAEETALDTLQGLIDERMAQVQQKIREKEWVEEDILQCCQLLVQSKRKEVERGEAELKRLLEERDALLHPRSPSPPPVPRAAAGAKRVKRQQPQSTTRQKKAPAKRRPAKSRKAKEAAEEAEDAEEDEESKSAKEDYTPSPPPVHLIQLSSPLSSPLLSPEDERGEAKDGQKDDETLSEDMEVAASDGGYRFDDEDVDMDCNGREQPPTVPSTTPPPQPHAAASPASSSPSTSISSLPRPSGKTRRALAPALTSSASPATASATESVIVKPSSSLAPSSIPTLSVPSPSPPPSSSTATALSTKPKRSLQPVADAAAPP